MRSRTLMFGVLGLMLASCSQLTPSSETRYFAKLEPGNEVTAPTISTSNPVWGAAYGRWEDKGLTITGNYSHLSGTPQDARVYLGKVGQEGTAFCTLKTEDASTKNDDGTVSGSLQGTCTVQDTAVKLDLLRAGRYYVNITTAQNPQGEVRGQLFQE